MLLIISLLAFGAERNRRCSEMPPPPVSTARSSRHPPFFYWQSNEIYIKQ